MIPWVDPGQALPAPDTALIEPNGLLAAGRDLSAQRLVEAYAQGIFPWFSEGQPVLWWSPNPRMVLHLNELRVTHSLAKKMRSLGRSGQWEVRMNTAFVEVMSQCALPRPDQDGTWISEVIIEAYTALHRAGLAHSVEVWEGSELIGGLYGVALGKMFYGESMFTRRADASKVALVVWARKLQELGFEIIDCQQNTGHLASFGAREIERATFLRDLHRLSQLPGPDWSSVRLALDSSAPVQHSQAKC